MTAFIAVLVAAVLYLIGQAAGVSKARKYWRDFGYCPTCDRLSEEIVQAVREQVAEEMSTEAQSPDSIPNKANNNAQGEQQA